MQKPHIPVLLNEVIEAFHDQPLEVFVDCTLGAGGHAEAILQAHPELRTYVGIDQDPLARTIAEKRLLPWQRQLIVTEGNFSQLSARLSQARIESVDGILMDLGVSSMQLDQPEKGFSFMQDGPLDMRMDPTAPLTAAAILNTWPEDEIGRILRDYGEEKQWRKASQAIVQFRPFHSTQDLVKKLAHFLAKKAKKGIHPLTLVFQGLRIAVNRELEVLESALPQAVRSLRPGGRLAVITFHSLEDRIVKQFFAQEASDKVNTSGLGGLFLDKDPTIRIINRKPIGPTEEEIVRNPRSRSAKLRIIEKLPNK